MTSVSARLRRHDDILLKHDVLTDSKEVAMSTQEVTWEVPEQLYRELVWAQESLNFPSVMDFITQAIQYLLNNWGWRHYACHMATSTGFHAGRTGRSSHEAPSVKPTARSAITVANAGIARDPATRSRT